MRPHEARAGGVLLVALLAGLSLQAPDAAEAQTREAGDIDRARAKALYQRAERFFFIGEFGRALGLYTEAFKTKPLPGFLFNIGQCQRKLGRCKQAIFNFKQYLHHLPDAPNRSVVEQLIALCETRIASDRQARQRAAAVREGPTGQPATTASPAPASTDGSSHRISPVWFWTTAGLAVALLATGAATGAVALNKSAEYKDPDTSKDRRREIRDGGVTMGTVSTVTLIAGVAASLGAGVLYYMTWQRGEQPTQTSSLRASAGVMSGGGAVFIEGRF